MVEVMRPEPGMTICDRPAATGGFLLAAYEWITNNQRPPRSRSSAKHLRFDALKGWEIVDNTARSA
jgi:type I restriction enzyme M protein